jgi:hypothetical protein
VLLDDSHDGAHKTKSVHDANQMTQATIGQATIKTFSRCSYCKADILSMRGNNCSVFSSTEFFPNQTHRTLSAKVKGK